MYSVTVIKIHNCSDQNHIQLLGTCIFIALHQIWHMCNTHIANDINQTIANLITCPHGFMKKITITIFTPQTHTHTHTHIEEACSILFAWAEGVHPPPPHIVRSFSTQQMYRSHGHAHNLAHKHLHKHTQVHSL